jgi:hypothetical protein
MNIKFPPLINVDGDLTGVSLFGAETVLIEVALRNKVATITLTRHEAERMFAGLKAAGIGAEAVPQSVALPRISLPGKK